MQAYGLRVMTQGSPLLSMGLLTPTHHLSYLFVQIALISVVSFPLTIKDPQIVVLKTLLVTNSPKRKAHDLDQI